MARGARGASSVLSATRLHFPPGTTTIPEATVQHLRNYAASTRELRVAAAVAVNALEAEVARILREAAPGLDVKVLHVPVWGAFIPALNTLLGEASRRGARYILYQSLEVRCAPMVLRKLLDHFTSDTLVVGPVLDGHTFQAGEQPLNGRTTPWNTLALWSTRKLGLTGFLSIADGMPEAAKRLGRQITGDAPNNDFECIRQGSDELTPGPSQGAFTLGSAAWWERNHTGEGWDRQFTELGDVPAGVEEVTAIALLQHLLGYSRARAVLLQLPEDLDSLVSWKTNWGGDERRQQWHEYKMASKVARPAAQIKQLFGKRHGWASNLQAALLPRPRLGSTGSVGELAGGGDGGGGKPQEPAEAEPSLKFGTVLHFGESIRPPPQVEAICLAAVALFSANFTSALASAFRSINKDGGADAQASLPVVTFVSLLIGGVYIPMPLSLCLTRLVASVGDHIAGLAFFAGTLALAHSAVVLWQVNGHGGYWQETYLLGARFLEGLGSGVLFQARFVLASMSTQDHHFNLQSRTFFAGDVGLGIGALLPYVASAVGGHSELPAEQPELMTSGVLAVASLVLFVWILAAFPRRIHRLPERVRFPVRLAEAEVSGEDVGPDPQWTRTVLVVSGTTRVFVQSAVIMVLAVWMRDIGMTGSFRQTKAVAALILLPVLIEAFSAGMCNCCPPWLSRPLEHTKMAALAAVAFVMALRIATLFVGAPAGEGEAARAVSVGVELVTLLVALALAAPLQVSRLYRVKDAERCMVVLEWLKAYCGRLLGPLVALAVQDWLGYGPVLALLCIATALVAVTA